MFTGIITASGRIEKITTQGASAGVAWRWDISAPKEFLSLPIGASICCSGACLTLVAADDKSFAVELTSETQERTNFAHAQVGTRLNLEKAMGAQSTFDGHILTGHIDGLAEITDIKRGVDEMAVRLSVPAPLAKFIAAKGSVALDGVSLTVNEVAGCDFTIMLIPHTLKVLGWEEIQKGYCFNLEIDILSRYVARYLERREQ